MSATRTRKRGPRQTTKCPCGCGQGAAGRSRKVTCPMHHYSAFVSRSTIAHGIGTCYCGEPLEPTCLNDRCYLPGDQGAAALEACSGIGTPAAGSLRGMPGPGGDEAGRCDACHQFTGRARGATCPHCGFSSAGGYALAGKRDEIPF